MSTASEGRADTTQKTGVAHPVPAFTAPDPALASRAADRARAKLPGRIPYQPNSQGPANGAGRPVRVTSAEGDARSLDILGGTFPSIQALLDYLAHKLQPQDQHADMHLRELRRRVSSGPVSDAVAIATVAGYGLKVDDGRERSVTVMAESGPNERKLGIEGKTFSSAQDLAWYLVENVPHVQFEIPDPDTSTSAVREKAAKVRLENNAFNSIEGKVFSTRHELASFLLNSGPAIPGKNDLLERLANDLRELGGAADYVIPRFKLDVERNTFAQVGFAVRCLVRRHSALHIQTRELARRPYHPCPSPSLANPMR